MERLLRSGPTTTHSGSCDRSRRYRPAEVNVFARASLDRGAAGLGRRRTLGERTATASGWCDVSCARFVSLLVRVFERIKFDAEAYERRMRDGPCFICLLASGYVEYRRVNVMIYEDTNVLVFLNRYPTVRGYTLVCPRRRVEHVVGEFSEAEYLQFQSWVYRVGRAIEQVIETERLYVLSLGSQQGNRHVHSHLRQR